MGTDRKGYKYYAFISYSSRNTAWGKRLQRILEHYRMPAAICSSRGWKRKPINPVWFAPTDIQPGGLDEELKNRLQDSGNLIVICSPDSARSEWVGKEIAYFHELGRDNSIHFFIVDGIPNSGDPATECFNPVIKSLGLPEILGVNIHEKIYRWPWLNRQRAYIQLISKLLGVEFDSLWRRQRRRLIARTMAWTTGILAVAAFMYFIWAENQPFDATVQLEEASVHNPDLPPLRDAVVTVQLENETRADTIEAEGQSAGFRNIPHKYMDKPARITFSCPDFLPIDTVINLSRTNVLKIRRDTNVYGNIKTSLYDFMHDAPVADADVIIGQWATKSDKDGNVRMSIPLERQQPKYIIRVPGYNVTDTITMPTNEYHTIGVNK